MKFDLEELADFLFLGICVITVILFLVLVFLS